MLAINAPTRVWTNNDNNNVNCVAAVSAFISFKMNATNLHLIFVRLFFTSVLNLLRCCLYAFDSQTPKLVYGIMEIQNQILHNHCRLAEVVSERFCNKIIILNPLKIFLSIEWYESNVQCSCIQHTRCRRTVYLGVEHWTFLFFIIDVIVIIVVVLFLFIDWANVLSLQKFRPRCSSWFFTLINMHLEKCFKTNDWTKGIWNGF